MAVVDQQASLPSEEHPEEGTIALGDVVISDVLHWVDAGVHIFRSTEFDVIAGDEDLRVAVGKFIANAEDYAGHLASLAEESLTPAEAEHVISLLRRLTRAYERHIEREQRTIIRINLPGRRRRTRGGYQQSRPLTSSLR